MALPILGVGDGRTGRARGGETGPTRPLREKATSRGQTHTQTDKRADGTRTATRPEENEKADNDKQRTKARMTTSVHPPGWRLSSVLLFSVRFLPPSLPFPLAHAEKRKKRENAKRNRIASFRLTESAPSNHFDVLPMYRLDCVRVPPVPPTQHGTSLFFPIAAAAAAVRSSQRKCYYRINIGLMHSVRDTISLYRASSSRSGSFHPPQAEEAGRCSSPRIF